MLVVIMILRQGKNMNNVKIKAIQFGSIDVKIKLSLVEKS